MTPKEKASVLYSQMIEAQDTWSNNTTVAKQSALILINEVLDVIYKDWYDSSNGVYEYWEEVKEELLKI